MQRHAFLVVAALSCGLPGRASAQAPSLAVVSTKVAQGEQLSVLLSSGEEVLGSLTEASDSTLTIQAGGAARTFAAPEIARVARRHGQNRRWRGIAIGAPVGMLFGTAPCYRTASTPGHDGVTSANTQGNTAGCLVGVSVGAAAGALIGAAIGSRSWVPSIVYAAAPRSGNVPEGIVMPAQFGSFVHERQLVYRAPEQSVRVTPMVTPRRLAVMGTIDLSRRR
jgi:hypothetical protein